MKREKYKLIDYSLYAGILIGIGRTGEGQIIYTDLDPDLVIDAGSGFIDMDNNGTQDFEFIKEHLSYSFTSIIECFHSVAFSAGIANIDNAIVGFELSWTNDFVYALENNYLINGSDQWNIDAWQLMTIKHQQASCLYYTVVLGPWEYFGSWASADGEDRYIGVRFKGDDPGCDLYGWIRCAITDTLETLTIKDYAYNAECDQGIYAGELVSSIKGSGNLKAAVYSFARNIYIHCKLINNTHLVISDMIGNKLIERDLLTSNETVNMDNHPDGIYLVTLIQGNERLNKNVFIE